MSLLDIMLNRRSVRTYKEGKISDEDLNKILTAGLSVPTGRNNRPFEFVLVREKSTLEKLMDCRAGGSKALMTADTAIIVLADEKLSATWIEDTALNLGFMHLMASDLGLGSCWLQLRDLPSNIANVSAESLVRGIIDSPMDIRIEGLLTIGLIDTPPTPHTTDDLNFSKIHIEKW